LYFSKKIRGVKTSKQGFIRSVTMLKSMNGVYSFSRVSVFLKTRKTRD